MTPIESLPHIVFIGGGRLMVDTIQAALTRGFTVGAILAPRHAADLLPEGSTLEEELKRLDVCFYIAPTALEVDPRRLGSTFTDVMALCFGPAWIFPDQVLALFPRGMFNFNGIPIPHYLGGAHYTWQILNRNRRAGCHIQRITSDVDRGELLMSESHELGSDVETPQDYFRENDRIGLKFLERFLDACGSGKTFSTRAFEEVDADRLYFPRLLTLQNGWIDWAWTGADIQTFCSAFAAPYLGASTLYRGERVRLIRTALLPEPPDQQFHPFCSGLIVRKHAGSFFVAVVGGLLRVDQHAFDSQGGPEIQEGERLFTDAARLAAARVFRPRLSGSKP